MNLLDEIHSDDERAHKIAATETTDGDLATDYGMRLAWRPAVFNDPAVLAETARVMRRALARKRAREAAARGAVGACTQLPGTVISHAGVDVDKAATG